MKTLSLSIILGIVISLGLFWLMQTMISNNELSFEKTDSIQMTEFVRLKRDSELQTKDRKKPEEPPPPEKRPPPPQMQMQQVQVTQNSAPQMDMPNLDIPLQTSRFSGSLLSGLSMGPGEISTNVIPLVKIQPRYPMRAQTRRIEGWVKVEFTITEQGTVKDAEVIDAQPSNIFNRSALQAIKRWKFRAKIIDGVAVEQRVVQTLTFTLKK